jgi:agmatine deiminase
VVKIRCTGDVILSDKEAGGVDPVEGTGRVSPAVAGRPPTSTPTPANGGLIMPLFDDPNDGSAAAVLRHPYPDRRTVTGTGRENVLGGSNVHCITQQQPWEAYDES